MNDLSVTHLAGGCPNALNWYALYVMPQCERMVQSALRRRRIEEYLPIYLEEVRWSDRVKVVERPLFPGYLFARFSARDYSIMRIPTVLSVLGTDPTHPTPIPEAEIQTVRDVIASGYPVSPWTGAVAGELVLVERGPFAGREGKLVKVKDSHRLVVDLPMLNRSVSVEIDADLARPLKKK